MHCFGEIRNRENYSKCLQVMELFLYIIYQGQRSRVLLTSKASRVVFFLSPSASFLTPGVLMWLELCCQKNINNERQA